ncbi:MAG TPA: FimV/HubP family polar landmark protein, partial [Methylophilaceae bacterium]|nr:FimV/HubP family polar landmark protein [Methylophilaceae bacterium]
SLDFSLDAEAPAPSAGPGNEQGGTDLDFDLGMGDSSLAESMAADSMVGASTPSDVSSDPLSMPETPANTALDSGATISMDLNEPTAGLDFQLDLPEQAAAGNDQLDMADLGTLPSLDVGDLAATKVDEPMESPTVQLDVADFGNTMPNLEVPTFDLPEATPAADTLVTDTKEDQALETISFDLPEVADDVTGNISLAEAEQTISMDVQDFDKTMMIQPSAVEEISFESTAEPDQALDLTFGALETSAGETQEVPAEPQPALDLTGISLDLGDTAAEPAISPAEPLMADAAPDMTATQGSVQDESDEVNTKLDLVTAYMEIGDNEGARELLDEVMKEGGPKQQARAKEILATIV